MVNAGRAVSPSGGGGAPMTPKSNRKNKASGGGGEASSNAGGHGHRTPDTDDPLLLSIASKQNTLVQQLITLTCYIPSSSVGAVIGRRGSTIAQIQRQAQQTGTSNGPVRLSIVGHQNEVAAAQNGESPGDTGTGINTPMEFPIQQQQQQQPLQTIQPPTTPTAGASSTNPSSVPYTYSELDWSSPLWTPVVIRTDPCAAITAAQLLRDKVGQLDDVVMDVPLGRAKHAAVVGRRGYVLANLSADTNVRIMVPRRELRHDVIQLEGELGNVKKCLERVLVIASDTSGSNKKKGTNTNNNTNNNNANEDPEKNDDTSPSVVVKVSALPSQTKLRTVGRKTATIIKKRKVDDSSWDLTVSGNSPENVQSAVAILKKWNDDNVNKNNNNNNNHNSESNEATPSTRNRGRGRQQGRNNNKGKGNNHRNHKGGKSNTASAAAESPAT